MNHVLVKCFLPIIFLIAISAFVPAYSADTKGSPLNGQTGASEQWGSGWIDLASPVNLVKGDVLRLKVGGSAQKVMVRCLAKGQSPDSTEGLVGDAVIVPKDRIINIRLSSSRNNIVQISVHGGANPWGMYPLGQSNGPATIDSAEIIRR
jgi:hypothetical protein